MSPLTLRTALLLIPFGLLVAMSAEAQHRVFTVYDEQTYLNIPKAALTGPGENPADIAVVDSPSWLDLYELPDSLLLSLQSGPNTAGMKVTRGVVFSYHTGVGSEERMVLVRIGNPQDAQADGFTDEMSDGFSADWTVQNIDNSIMTFDSSKLTLSLDENSTGVDSLVHAPDHDQPNNTSNGSNLEIVVQDTAQDGDLTAVYTAESLPQVTLYTGVDATGAKVLELRLEGEPDAFELTTEVFGAACNAPSCATAPLPLLPLVKTLAQVNLQGDGTQAWLTLSATPLDGPSQTTSSTIFVEPTWTGWHGGLEHQFGATEIANFQGTTELEIYRVTAGYHSKESSDSQLRAMDNFGACTFGSDWDTQNVGALELVAEGGTGAGCRVEVDMADAVSLGGNSVLLDSSPTWDSKFTARFRLDTSQLTMNPGESIRIWGGKDAGGTHHVQLRLNKTQNRYNLQLQARDYGGNLHFGPAEPLHATSREIYVHWKADAADGGAVFFIDGVEGGKIDGIDTSLYRMDLVRFGAVYPISTGGTLILDDYVSWP